MHYVPFSETTDNEPDKVASIPTFTDPLLQGPDPHHCLNLLLVVCPRQNMTLPMTCSDRLKTLSMLISLIKRLMITRSSKKCWTRLECLLDSNQCAKDATKSVMKNPTVIPPSTHLFIAMYASFSIGNNPCIANITTFPPSHFVLYEGTYRMTIPIRG